MVRETLADAWRAVVNAGISGSDARDLMLEAVERRFGTCRPPSVIEILSDSGPPYIAKETRVFARQLGLALLHPGAKPAEQWHLGGLREDAEARLGPGDAAAGCPDCPRIDRRMDRRLQREPPALRTEDAAAPRVLSSSNRNRLRVRRNGGKTTLLVTAPRPLREQVITVTGRRTLVRGLAALRPGSMTSITASAKTARRALARRWPALDLAIREHDVALEELVRKRAPALMATPGISTGTVAEMLVVLGDNPGRIRSEAAFAKLCGICPIPASSGKTIRHRLDRGGNRCANAARHREAVVRMRSHHPTIAYLRRRTAEGKSAREIRRCLKRYIAREIFRHPCAEPPANAPASKVA